MKLLLSTWSKSSITSARINMRLLFGMACYMSTRLDCLISFLCSSWSHHVGRDLLFVSYSAEDSEPVAHSVKRVRQHFIQKPHDDVIKWIHYPRYWPFVRGIHRSPVNSPHKGQWRGALMFSSICVWINGLVNNREAGDLRRYRANYDVTVMLATPLVSHMSIIASFTFWRCFSSIPSVNAGFIFAKYRHVSNLLNMTRVYGLILAVFCGLEMSETV